jgi:hypothetical protein
VALLLHFSLAYAEAQRTFFAIGGSYSCATWLSSPENERDGTNWLLGFWSGKNIEKKRDGTIGSNTDTAGIVAEVKLNCQTEPSQSLLNAVNGVYTKMESEAAHNPK